MRSRTTSIGKKVTTALLALAMTLGLAPGAALAEQVATDKTVACVGTNAIVAKNGDKDQFSGSFVYYGTYDQNPTRYRVLANGTTDFSGNLGGPTMLLDCDAILATTAYGSSRAWGTSESPSTLKSWVTIGEDGTFGNGKKGAFTVSEVAAIAQSSTDREGELAPDVSDIEGKDFKLTGEKTFVLSAGEANNYYANKDARKKYGLSYNWWLRSAGMVPDHAETQIHAAHVSSLGAVVPVGSTVDSTDMGVSPAFNIDLTSVIFSSLISDEDNTYKLTVKDAGLGTSGSAILEGTQATVTYSTTGDATQASYLVTDQAWSDGWPADAALLAYGRLGEAGEGQGAFSLPDGCAAGDWGTKYHVYVLAESVSAGKATDYASTPVEVTKTNPVATPTFEPAAGTYSSEQSVKIGCATEGATIHYTTDGTEPTRDSATYAGPIAVSSPTTIRAIAVKEGMSDSVVAEAKYEITIPVETYKVTMTADPAEGGTAKAEPAEAPAGTSVRLIGEPAEGWELVGWTTQTPDVTIADGSFTMPGSDVAVTATFKKKDEPKPAGGIVPVARGHVQNVGNVAGEPSGKGVKVGTEGKSQRLESFALDLPKDTEGGIEYRGHIQNKGWDEWVAGGKTCGTAHQSLRLEAVQLRLTGKLADTHDVWYRVHAQNFGTLGWAKGGQAAGTAGQALRVESLEVQVLPKGETPADHEDGKASFVGAVTADVHVQDVGWTGAQSALEFGTTGQARRLEAMRVSMPGLPLGGGIHYEVHAQDMGWMLPVANGGLAGTTGRSKRLEAVRIRLTGDAAKEGNFSVWYRVHSQDYGWLGWAKDGAEAGTSGLSKRAEAIDVQVLPQGQVPRGYDASRAACIKW